MFSGPSDISVLFLIIEISQPYWPCRTGVFDVADHYLKKDELKTQGTFKKNTVCQNESLVKIS